ncbi:hypothetical protein ACTTAI_19550 [Rhodobacter capsulatus]|uniref:hypothetical protein n=1 Tax=Rhodobacter capsulatus TaxID=1061 RepID=UPI004028AB7C
MEFYLRITLPEAPGVNLAEKIEITGFISRVRTPIPPETDMDVIRNDIADYLVSEGIVTAERRGELMFDFG